MYNLHFVSTKYVPIIIKNGTAFSYEFRSAIKILQIMFSNVKIFGQSICLFGT